MTFSGGVPRSPKVWLTVQERHRRRGAFYLSRCCTSRTDWRVASPSHHRRRTCSCPIRGADKPHCRGSRRLRVLGFLRRHETIKDLQVKQGRSGRPSVSTLSPTHSSTSLLLLRPLAVVLLLFVRHVVAVMVGGATTPANEVTNARGVVNCDLGDTTTNTIDDRLMVTCLGGLQMSVEVGLEGRLVGAEGTAVLHGAGEDQAHRFTAGYKRYTHAVACRGTKRGLGRIGYRESNPKRSQGTS